MKMALDWQSIDRWVMGEAWTGARIREHLRVLCEEIGPRWSSSPAEWRAIRYIQRQMEAAGLDPVAVEEYPLETWAWQWAQARVVEDERPIDLLPFNRCPPCQV